MTDKVLKWVLGFALLFAIVAWGIRMYGNSRVQGAALEAATDAVSEAVVERKQAVRTDVAQTQARAAAVDSVRRTVAIARKETSAVKNEIAGTGCAVESDAERLRVLNRTIDELNERTTAAAILHD